MVYWTRRTGAVILRRAFHGEIFRLRRLRPVRVTWLIAIGLVAVLGLVTALRLAVDADQQSVVTASMSAADTAPIVLGLGALLVIASDFGGGSIGATLLIVPQRSVVIVAKVLASLAAAAVFAVAYAAVTAAIVIARDAVATEGAGGFPVFEWAAGVLAGVGITVAYVMFGAGIALLTCGSASAVLVYLSVLFAVPIGSVVLGVWMPSLGQFLVEMSPVTLTVRLLQHPHDWEALGWFAVLDLLILGAGFVRAMRVRIR